MSRRCPLFLAPYLLLIACSTSLAADYTWNTAAIGDWNAPGNWSPSGIPALGDNVTIGPSGTYTINLNGDQSANNVLLSSDGATVNAFGRNFTLGGTMTLSAGNWVMGGFMGAPATFTGGTITRAAGDTGNFTVDGDLRLVNTQIANAAVLQFSHAGGARLRLSGTSAFAPGSVLTIPYRNGAAYSSGTGITFESGGTLNNLTVNLAVNTTLGTVGGQSLTFGPNTLVQYSDPNFGGPAIVGREFLDGTSGMVTLTNQGTIRCTAGELYLGRLFSGNTPSSVDITNAGLIEAGGFMSFNVNNFTNSPGGILRATGGGGVFLFARNSWVNGGTFEVSGAGSSLYLGGLFTRAAMGTITRSGAGTVVGIFAGSMDNSGGTWALNATTGTIQLLGDGIASSGRIIGGAITAADGAKLEVRPYPGVYSGVDYCRLTGVAVGPGVLSFPTTGGKVWLEGGTTLAAGDTITLAGNDTAVAYFQTQQVDGVAFVLSGDGSALQVFDNNVLTLGPASVVRKTGTGLGSLTGGLFSHTSGSDTAMVNRGLVHVEQGTLRVNASSTFAFTNRGTVQVDAGATLEGSLTTNGGTVRGGGTITGNLSFTGADNHLRPGASPGILTVGGSLTLNSGTTLHAELNGNTPGTGHDQLAVTGTVTLGNAELDLTLGGGYTPAFTDKLFLITNAGDDAISGEFANMPHLSQITIGGYLATISYFGNSTTGTVDLGNDLVVYNFTPVPEPGAVLALAAAAGSGGGLWRRVRRGVSH